MLCTILAAVALAGVPAMSQAQSTSAPLVVSATVVSSCTVKVPRIAESSLLHAMPVDVTCARGAAAPRVQRPSTPPRDVRDAVLIINF
jgi:hypothetical protein